jgi:hypothetical protein
MAKTCNNCGTNPEKKTGYDLAVAICERTTKRLWIALIIVICMLFASNGIWLYCWMQYDYESYEVVADGDSNANYIGQDGNIYNGSEGIGPEENKK